MKKRWYKKSGLKGLMVCLTIVALVIGCVCGGASILLMSKGIRPLDSRKYVDSERFTENMYETSHTILEALGETEILNERQFVEYTKKGYPTIFTVTAEETDRLWEFDLENNTMQGHWRGVFLAKGKETELDFTEQIHCKKLILRPFIKLYLKSQQSRYVSDLKKALR